MNHSVYKITREKRRNMTFSFISNNANGTNPVRKVIVYVPMVRYGKKYYNLEFGDFDYKDNMTDYSVVTDNGDMRKVLKTVASTLEEFFSQFKDASVHIDGSDLRRHAYYHKLIRDYYRFIIPLYQVHGYIQNRLEEFKIGVAYDAIIVRKR